MKLAAIIFSLSLFGFTAQAQAKTMTCSFEHISNIAQFSDDEFISERSLSPSEQGYIKMQIDREWDCERVLLVGAVKTEAGYEYITICMADGAGPDNIYLPLECKEKEPFIWYRIFN